MIDVQNLRGVIHFPGFAIFHYHAQENVIVLRRSQFRIEQALFEAPCPGKDLVADDIAFVKQTARVR
ncbi:hypothetical protein D3C71_1709590 [compost metagenome]